MMINIELNALAKSNVGHFRNCSQHSMSVYVRDGYGISGWVNKS